MPAKLVADFNSNPIIHKSEYALQADRPLTAQDFLELAKTHPVNFEEVAPLCKYVAVFGTLRYGRGNWEDHLKNKAKLVATLKIPNIWFMGGLGATYTDTKHTVVKGSGLEYSDGATMDIFDITAYGKEKSVEEGLNDLEHPSYYKRLIFPLEINGQVELVKFYYSYYDLNKTAVSDVQDYAILSAMYNWGERYNSLGNTEIDLVLNYLNSIQQYPEEDVKIIEEFYETYYNLKPQTDDQIEEEA
jgi:hypothetical protein